MIHFERLEDGTYKTLEEFVYYSKRYDKTVTVPLGFISDGASGPAEDIVSDGWFVHDVLCETYKFDDGSKCSRWQGSMILHDILKSEGRWFRCWSWLLPTWIAGVF
jgi:hypothetical protein